jgi:hypothetical protein
MIHPLSTGVQNWVITNHVHVTCISPHSDHHLSTICMHFCPYKYIHGLQHGYTTVKESSNGCSAIYHGSAPHSSLHPWPMHIQRHLIATAQNKAVRDYNDLTVGFAVMRYISRCPLYRIMKLRDMPRIVIVDATG